MENQNKNQKKNHTSYDSSFYELMSLPEKEVRIINVEKLKDNKFIITIKWKVISQKCSNCWSYKTKRVWNKYEVVSWVKHLFISNYITVDLVMYKRRYLCEECTKNNWWNRKYFIEQFSFINKNSSYSKTFKFFILKEWRYQSLEELARKFNTSSNLVYEVINNEVKIDDLILNNIKYLESLDIIYLWIDEVSFKWHDYFLHITELKQKKTIAVLKSNSVAELKKWLDKLPIEVLKKIRFIWSDMNSNYKNTVQEYIKNKLKAEIDLWIVQESEIAEWVSDHYHIKQMLNNSIMEIYNINSWMIKEWYYDKNRKWKNLTRRDIINSNKYRTDSLVKIQNIKQNAQAKVTTNKKTGKQTLKFDWILEWKRTLVREYKPECDEYKPITLWFFLTKRYHNLLWLSENKLTEMQKHRLNQILIEFDPEWFLSESYLWKELLSEAIEEKNVSLLNKVINDFKSSLHYKLQELWNTLWKWSKEIENFFKTWISNAFTEWVNTQIKLFKKMAFWYKIKENYMKRILLSLGNCA